MPETAEIPIDSSQTEKSKRHLPEPLRKAKEYLADHLKNAVIPIGVAVIVISAACTNAENNTYATNTPIPNNTPGVDVPTPMPSQIATVEATNTAQPAKTPEATTSPEAVTRKNIEVYADPSIPKNVKNRVTGDTLEESIAKLKLTTDPLPNFGNNRKIKLVPGEVLGADPNDPTQVLIGIDFYPQIRAFYALHEIDHVETTTHYADDTKATAEAIADRTKYMNQDQIDQENKLIEDSLASPEGRQYPVLAKMFTKSKLITPLVGTVTYSREQLLDWMGQYSDNMWLQTGTVNFTGMSEGKNIENTDDASFHVPVTYGLITPETFKKIDEIAKAADTKTIQPYKNLPDFLQKNEQLINEQILNNPQITASERAITQKSFELLKAQQNLFTWENIFAYPDLYGKYDAGWKSALKSYLQLAFEEKYIEGDQSVISLIPQDKMETYDNAVKTKLAMADTELLAQWHATVVYFHIEGTALDPYLNYQQQISTGQIVKLQ